MTFLREMEDDDLFLDAMRSYIYVDVDSRNDGRGEGK